MRRSGQPSRPRARICCLLATLKMLAIPAGNHALHRRVNVLGRRYFTGRFSGVHDWPVLGVHRGVGIATFVMREREHLAALRPEGRGIMLTTMWFADEIRSAEDLALPEEGEHPKKEMDLALQLVDALADDWDPTEYHDTYRETLRAAIEQKVDGKEISVPTAAVPPKVTDLMEALRASLARKDELKKAPSRTTAPEKAAPPRRRRTSGRSSAA